MICMLLYFYLYQCIIGSIIDVFEDFRNMFLKISEIDH